MQFSGQQSPADAGDRQDARRRCHRRGLGDPVGRPGADHRPADRRPGRQAPLGPDLRAQSSDVLALQAELASAIADAINVQLTPGEQSRLSAAPTWIPRPTTPTSRDAIFFNRPSDENLQKAIAQFNEAIRLSPDLRPGVFGAVGRLYLGRLQRGLHQRRSMQSRTPRPRQNGRCNSTACRRRRTPRSACTRPGSTSTGRGVSGSSAGRSPSIRTMPLPTTSSA